MFFIVGVLNFYKRVANLVFFGRFKKYILTHSFKVDIVAFDGGN